MEACLNVCLLCINLQWLPTSQLEVHNSYVHVLPCWKLRFSFKIYLKSIQVYNVKKMTAMCYCYGLKLQNIKKQRINVQSFAMICCYSCIWVSWNCWRGSQEHPNTWGVCLIVSDSELTLSFSFVSHNATGLFHELFYRRCIPRMCKIL